MYKPINLAHRATREGVRQMIPAVASPNVSKRVLAWAALGFVTIELISLVIGRLTGVGLVLAAIPAIIICAFVTSYVTPLIGCSLLIVTCFADRPEIPIGVIHLRVPELTALGLAAAALTRQFRSDQSLRNVAQSLASIPLFWPIVAFLATNYFSILFSPEKLRSFELCLIYTALAWGYFGFVMMVSSRDRHKLVVVLYVAAVLEAVVGLALLGVGSVKHQIIYGIQYEPASGYFEAIGTLQDANYFGSFLITPFLVGLSLVMLHRPPQGARARLGWTVAGLGLLATAIVASLTRGAWLGFVSGMVIYYAVGFSRASRITTPRLAAIACLSVAAAASGLLLVNITNFGAAGLTIHGAQQSTNQSLDSSGQSTSKSTSQATSAPHSLIATRLETAFDFTKGSTQGRLFTTQQALNEWRSSPIFGAGTGSFHSAPAGDEHPWITSMFVAALHDTGAIGLVVIIWLLIAYLRQLWRAVWHQNLSEFGPFTLSFLAGSAGLFIAFQASTAMILMYPWMLIALGVSLTMRSRRDTPETEAHYSQMRRQASRV